MAESQSFSFAGFVLNFDARTLIGGGEPRHLTPKAFDLLALLVARRPAAVSKADIHAELWPGVFVSDVNLAALIFELRAALGESARAARYIRTVHGFGYAFAAEPSITLGQTFGPFEIVERLVLVAWARCSALAITRLAAMSPSRWSRSGPSIRTVWISAIASWC